LFRRPQLHPVQAAVVLATLTVTLLGAVACTAKPAQTAAAPSPSGSIVTEEPTPEPTPTPSLELTPEPTAPPKTTAPPPPPAPVVPVNLPMQTGTGPAGSLRSTGSESVALTFDDGPDPVYTPQMLDLLKAHGVKATFCLIGRLADAYPAIVARIAAEGHTLCNHTWSHSLDLGKQTKEVMLNDLMATSNVIHKAAPGAPIKYFRAPGGYFTTTLVEVATSLGMRSMYWGVDTRDWETSKWGTGQTMVNHIVSVIETKTRRGSIILSHDAHKPDTLAAYKQVLPWLQANVKLIPMPV
jgi:peptidoglycan/xylan/chitin deacetylase (PgdA/CDA1 family)